MPNSISDTIKLNDGHQIPILGFGTYKLADQDSMDAAIDAAFKAGYRLFDTAQFYNNEHLLGNSIKKLQINRNEIFITTKIPEPKQGYQSTLDAIDESLANLQTDYIDLLLVHWPVRSHFFETWRAFEDAKKAGKVKSIGVSNYHQTHLDLLKTQATEMPAVNQIEVHPYLSQKSMLAANNEEQIVTQAWSPMGRGATLHDETIQAIAKAHGKSVAQVILKWHLQNGVAIIPKSSTPERILENGDLFDFELSDHEMQSIDDLNQDMRTGDDPEVVYEIEHQYPRHK
ncbi:aldo/keto reductase [Apilactobacillus apinorum]|uniref:aldo/keto reductase n=1 Tax=Apilactobacillus apinorum TaxID=1218495 RepID=UPI0006B561ED|nr:aldo/keto reductase [Apilactobacillus apinorum]KOY69655.1 2,5-didehydrogluconate reductase [Apilactobacillus apinorum]CAI2617098.1 2,5-didehydrogluconate reductase [Apilactobacillus apinorum]